MIEFHLCCVFLILVILLLFKFYLDNIKINDNININKNKNKCNCNKNKCNCEAEFNLLLNKMKLQTSHKINDAIEQGMIEGFDNMDIKPVNKIVSYTNNNEEIKLLYFYKENCPYCDEFMSIWYQIINNLPNNILYEEINTDKYNVSKKISDFNIVSVPTLILVVGGKQQLYKGKKTYKDIDIFLKENKINLTARMFEEFDDNGYSSISLPPPPPNARCPNVTFDAQIDVVKDEFLFQIFNKEGQYGYATGNNKEGSILSPFDAAYSVVDSYLSSLPDKKNMNECANLYSNNIRQFGLCDPEKLTEKLNYNDIVKNGQANIRFEGTDYSTNKDIVNAIKSACDS